MSLSFNPAPGWPAPPSGWFPTEDWSPDASWPPAPRGWQLVVLDGAPVDPPPGETSTPAAREPKVSPSCGVPPPERAQAPVTSEGITYDRALLPAGFLERGISGADQAWWDVRFLSALIEQDQPLIQALAQGEADRVGDHMEAMGRELEAMEPGEANRRRRSMLVEADRAEDLLRHVQSEVERFRRR